MRNTLIPILVAICLFITGVAILNIQLWYSAKAEYLAGARYAANNINHILEEASQATQTAVNIAGKECDLEEQYQLGTEAALKPHLRTITSQTGNGLVHILTGESGPAISYSCFPGQ